MESMERLNLIKKPEIIHTPSGEWKLFDDESRIERLSTTTFKIELAQRDDGLWFWAISCNLGCSGCGYALCEECGEYSKDRQGAINAAALEIVEWAKHKKLKNNCIEWLLDVTQSLVKQEELF